MTDLTLQETIWKDAVPYLTNYGVTEASARSFVGSLLGKYEHPIIRQALSQCMNGDRVDPRGYIRKRCKQLEAEKPRDLNELSNDALARKIEHMDKFCATRQAGNGRVLLQRMRDEMERRTLV